MTDHPDPLDPLDELASAHLDGLTSADEVARMQADPRAGLRLEQLQAVRDALRATAGLSVDSEHRDAAIEAALTAFDEAGEPARSDARATTADASRPPPGHTDPDDHAGALVPFGPAAGRRHLPTTRTLRVIAVAAAAALIALVVPLLDHLDSDPREATTSEEAATAPSSGAADDATAGRDAPASTDARAFAAEADLGSFPDIAGLTGAVRAALDHPSQMEASAPPTDAKGSDPGAPCTRPTETLFTALAEVAGRPVVVFVTAQGDVRHLDVLDRSSCTLVVTASL